MIYQPLLPGLPVVQRYLRGMAGVEVGSPFWVAVGKCHPRARRLADRHYSRQSPGALQFMPPGQVLILLSRAGDALFGWVRPHPESGIAAQHGLDAWMCSIFRNESQEQSSELIVDAERVLLRSGLGVGKDGLVTFVWDSRVKSSNPGWCFQVAGWAKSGRSADGAKTRLVKRASAVGRWPARR